MTYLIIGAAIVVVILFAANGKALKRVWDAAAGQFTRLANGLFKRDPVAVMELENDRMAADAEAAWDAMVDSEALQNRLRRTIADKEKEAQVLQKLAEKEARAGNDEEAKNILVRKVAADRLLATQRAELQGLEEEYKENKKRLEGFQAKIQRNREEAKSIGVQLKVTEAQARIAQRMPDLTSKPSEAREAALERLDEAKGRLKVEKDRRRTMSALEDMEADADVAEAERLLKEMK